MSKTLSGVLKAVANGRGGIHTAYNKNTAEMPVERMPIPSKVVLPMAQHIGAPCTPTVKVGDIVSVGQVIGDSDKFVSAPIHATISGKVTAVSDIKMAHGMMSKAVTIESDGEMRLYEGLCPPTVTNRKELCEAVRQSGLVGLGGAGFPTHVKLNFPEDKGVDTLIINAAECEPYITVDYRCCVEDAQDILEGVYKLNNDLYPEIKSKIDAKIADPDYHNKVRLEYIKHFGYYCTESSEHNAEFNMFYIKSKYPELIEKYNIPLDEYPRRCVNQIEGWKKEYEELLQNGVKEHERSLEYASRIMEAIVTGNPYSIGGNVLNTGHLITNLPENACVEVPCLVDGYGVHPCHVGALPVQCAAMNMTNINVQLLTIEAAATRKKEHIYQAAMLDPHTGSELDIDTIKKMVDDLIEAHGNYLPKYN